MSERWRETFPCMATQTAHLKMSAPNDGAVSGANPLTLLTASSQTSVETPVKNAFSAADGGGAAHSSQAIPGRLGVCGASNPGILRCHYCTITTTDSPPPPDPSPPPPTSPMHLHNLHREKDGGMQREGRWGKPQEAHIQLHLAVWRDKDGSLSGAHAAAGFDDYTLRRSHKHADRWWKEPTPPPH